MSPTKTYRLAMRTAGFDPIPVNGKKPMLSEWQKKANATPEEIASWPDGNTGALTERTPALDIDIMQQDAADAVESYIRERFDGQGVISPRFGNAPKRSIMFRTDAPFAKRSIVLAAPDGKRHKIEVLGAGQQTVVDGTHPDTGKQFSWHGGVRPGDGFMRQDLPAIDAQVADRVLEDLAALLARDFGFIRVTSNGTSGGGDLGEGASAPVDVAALLAAMAPGNVNATQVRVCASRISRGDPVEDVVSDVADATIEMAARYNLNWDRDAEIWGTDKFPGLWKLCTRWITKLCNEYVPGVDDNAPVWIPQDFHETWRAALAEGKRPLLIYKNIDGRLKPEVRGYPRKDADIIQLHQTAAKSSVSRRALLLQPFKAFDVAALPPREWLYGKHYQRRTVSLTAGPGGMGKSSLDLVEAIAMATARNLLGEQPIEKLRVWVHNGEDPLDEIKRRVAAICQHYGIPFEELEGQLWITSGNEFPLRVAKGYTNLEIDTELVRQISAAIADNEIDVAIFDPFVTLHSVSEMDTGKMDAVIRTFAGIGDENDTAIELAHHVRKPAAGITADYDVHDIRGVTAITDAVRAARILNRMNEKDAQDAGLEEADRLCRFRVDRAKGNYSPAGAATWRQFINVTLANTDEVGVVGAWAFPGQGERTPQKAAAEQKADTVFLHLLDRYVAQGVNVSPNGGPNYAPAKFAKEREARAAKVGKAMLEGAMRRLLENRRVKAENTGRSTRLVPWQEESK